MNLWMKKVRQRRTNSTIPPIGILLCTRKGKKMVEYALAGMDNNLFVSTYMLQLSDKSTLERFLLDEMENHNDGK